MAWRIIVPHQHDGELHADTAYIDELLGRLGEQEQNLRLRTPVKKKKRTTGSITI